MQKSLIKQPNDRIKYFFCKKKKRKKERKKKTTVELSICE